MESTQFTTLASEVNMYPHVFLPTLNACNPLSSKIIIL